MHSHLPYAPIPAITPTADATLPNAAGGTFRSGAGPLPPVFLFFATWDQEVTSLGGHLDALNRYQTGRRRRQAAPADRDR